MKIDKDGKIGMFDRVSLEIMNEFDFNVEAMADEIIELRDKLTEAQEKLDEATS